MTPPGSDNDTVRIRLAAGKLRPTAPAPSSASPPAAAPARRAGFPSWAIGAAAGLALGAGLTGWLVWPRPAVLPPGSPAPPAVRPVAPPPVTPTAVAPAPAVSASAPPVGTETEAPAPGTPAFVIRTADRRQILDDLPAQLTVFRFAANPRIVVLDCPSLRMQGLMLDRVAALVEKSGMPRDRVVTEAELLAAIRAHGDTISTYYYGHDYSASDLARFFALARRDHIALNAEEQQLRALMGQLGWFAPGVRAGLITLPRLGANRYVTREARNVILTHELSHGEFFSDPAYAAYVRRFWQDDLTATERTAMRRFLASEEYDTTDRELMQNEMQAYVMFTRNPEFFRAADIGISDARRAELQREFVAGMPAGWLKARLARLNAEP